MGFTGNPKGSRYAIIALLVIFALGAGYCAKSEAQDSGLSIGFGIATAGAERCFDSMMLAQRFGDWMATLSTHGESAKCRDNEPIDANVGVGIVRVTDLGKWSIGFGAGLWEHGDVVVGPKTIMSNPAPRRSDRVQLCAHILIRYRLGKRGAIDWLHCSSAGSTHYNRGLNLFTLSVRI